MGVRVPKPVLIVVALVLVGLLGWGGWVWTHPTLLRDRSDLGNGIFPVTPLADSTAQISVAVPAEGDDETIEFKSASAQFTTNTARATATFEICYPRKPRELIGAVLGDLGKYCERVVPLTNGTKMHWVDAPFAEYVVMTVTPSRAGTATVDRVTFNYARSKEPLWQHGASRSAVHFVVRAK